MHIHIALQIIGRDNGTAGEGPKMEFNFAFTAATGKRQQSAECQMVFANCTDFDLKSHEKWNWIEIYWPNLSASGEQRATAPATAKAPNALHKLRHINLMLEWRTDCHLAA